jgi:hypothetical protein
MKKLFTTIALKILTVYYRIRLWIIRNITHKMYITTVAPNGRRQKILIEQPYEPDITLNRRQYTLDALEESMNNFFMRRDLENFKCYGELDHPVTQEHM